MKHTVSIAIGSILSLLYSTSVDSFYPFECVAFALISLIFVLSVGIRFIKTKNFEDLTFLPIISLSWVYFLNPFLRHSEVEYVNRNIPNGFYFELALYPALAIVIMYIGYYSFFKENQQINKHLFNPNLKLSETHLKKIILLFGTIGLNYNILQFTAPDIIDKLSNVIQIFSYSSIISVCFFLIYKLRGYKSNWLFVFVSMVFVVMIFDMIASTLFAYIIRFVTAVFFVYIFEKKKIPYTTVILVTILIFPLFAQRSEFRGKYYSDSFNSQITKGWIIFSESYTNFSFANNLNQNTVEETTSQRFENLSYLGQCVYMHEYEGKTFRNGETFWWLPLTPVPRFLFPWKPENIMATKMAYEYGLKMIDDRNSAFNFPMFAEAYINFGFWGIVIWGFIQGIFFKYFLTRIAYGQGDLNLMVLLNFIPWLTHMEGNITLVFGGIIQVYLFWWVLSKLKIHEKL